MTVHLSAFGADIVQRTISPLLKATRDEHISIETADLSDEQAAALAEIEDLHDRVVALLNQGGELDVEDLEQVQTLAELTGELVDEGTIPENFIKIAPARAEGFVGDILASDAVVA